MSWKKSTEEIAQSKSEMAASNNEDIASKPQSNLPDDEIARSNIQISLLLEPNRRSEQLESTRRSLLRWFASCIMIIDFIYLNCLWNLFAERKELPTTATYSSNCIQSNNLTAWERELKQFASLLMRSWITIMTLPSFLSREQWAQEPLLSHSEINSLKVLSNRRNFYLTNCFITRKVSPRVWGPGIRASHGYHHGGRPSERSKEKRTRRNRGTREKGPRQTGGSTTICLSIRSDYQCFVIRL
jgi:hypothetical protein